MIRSRSMELLRYVILSCVFFSLYSAHGKRAIIIGASFGMGREVAKLLAADGYVVGLMARRKNLLEDLQHEIPSQTYIQEIDIANTEDAVQKLKNLILQMGGIDLLVLSISGRHEVNGKNRDWKSDKAIFDVDIIGFFALARTALNFFEAQRSGHLVGFSSIDGLRGVANCPSYSAAKAFCSRYMEAERNRYIQKNIPLTITEIIPGWINSAENPDFRKKNPKAYWVDSLHDASVEIFEAIKEKKTKVYITHRWEEVAGIIHSMSDELYNALGGL